MSVDDLKTTLCEQFSEYIESCETQFGYVVPGHGMKGKEEKISTGEQLAVMYEKHKKKKRILLWLKCIPKSKKRASTQGDAHQSKRHASFLNMMSEVNDIVSKLKERHGEKYTPVQLNSWAHMINTHKHESLDSPPKKSFFGKKRSDDAPGVSPGKRITLGQLENKETRERKREQEREQEGTPKTKVNIFDRAAHNKAIVF